MGTTATGEVIVVAHQYFVEEPEARIRILSARSATPKERDNMKKSNDDFVMKKEYDFSNATRGRFYSPRKISTTIRLDDDVLLYLKKLASIKKVRYQTLLNSILRDYVQKVAQ